MFAEFTLDSFDYRLLHFLQNDARISQLDLADRVGLSPTACARRIRTLESIGVIRGYRSDIDAAALGYSTIVIVAISLEKQSEEMLRNFERAVTRCPNVVSCHLMSGADDYLLHIAARGIEDYERLHKQYLSTLPGVARIKSSFAMREIVRRSIPDNVFSASKGAKSPKT